MGRPIDYWLISIGKDSEPGIHGSFARKKDRPASGVLITAQVDSVDDYKNIVLDGGSIIDPKRVMQGGGTRLIAGSGGKCHRDKGKRSFSTMRRPGPNPVRYTDNKGKLKRVRTNQFHLCNRGASLPCLSSAQYS
jgi:hypothetical protein